VGFIERYDVSGIERPTKADLEQLARRRLEARRRGYELVLIGVGERLRLLLTVTGLDEVFVIGEVEPDAES
jgi:anti-anti-sigma regulatory factor